MVVKSAAEITTIVMRLEQTGKNVKTKDEIHFDKAIKRIVALHHEMRKRTDYKFMKMALKKWMK